MDKPFHFGSYYDFDSLPIDTPTKNGRTYPRQVLEKAVAKYKEDFVDKGCALVTTFSNTGETHLSDVVGSIISLNISPEAKMMTVLVRMLQSPPYMQVTNHFVEDLTERFWVMPFGVATVDENNVVKDDYTISGFHIDLKR
jgi:hypothetical protein